MLVQPTEKKTNQPDAELAQLVDAASFGTEEITADNLFEKFCEDAEFNFFPAFRHKEEVARIFKNQFAASANAFVERAEKIIDGEFDSLGAENSGFGSQISKHYEPDADQSLPFKSQRQIEELATAEKTGNEKLVQELSRQQYFFTLGAAFWLTGDERCAECFSRRLDDWMRENPPGANINWASGLEIAHRAMSWVWAFHFFKDSKHFTPELFQQALKFVYRHGEYLMKNLSTADDRPNARLTGEALGLYYLGTQFQFFKAARLWRETGAKILFEELKRQILPDGVCFERSIDCQRDAADFYTHFLILQTLNSGEETDKELQIKLGAKLQSLVDFLMSATRPDGTTPIVGDGERCLPLGDGKRDDFRAVLSTNAVLFERGDYKFVAGEFAEETLWLLGGAGEQSFESLRALTPDESSVAFEAGGYYIMRDGWTEADNFLLIACGESGATSGERAEALAVDVAVGGAANSVDSETYARHESEATRDRFLSTKTHNTLTIDDESPSATNGDFTRKTKADAKLNRWISEPRFDFFEGSRAGDERLPATHTRSVLFLKNDYWIFRDFVKASGKHDYKLNFHFGGATDPQIKSAENGNVCVVVTPDAKSGVRLFTFGDNGDWQRKEAPISDSYGGKIGAPLLQYSSSGVGAQEFFTFLLPSEANAGDAPQVCETEIIGGRAFVVNFRGYQDLLVFTDGGQIIRTEIFDTNFSFLWTRLGAEEILPEEFVLIGGTHFVLNGREIINHPHELESATARRFDNKLNVQTPEDVFSVSLPARALNDSYRAESGVIISKQ